MTLTDQELWHILQVAPPAAKTQPKARPWERQQERDDSPVLAQAWIAWAKAEVLSLGGASPSRVHSAQCVGYLARLVRILDVLAEYRIAHAGRGREGGGMYEESYLNALLSNGLAACDCSTDDIEHTIFLAKRDGVLTDHEVDDWHPGMESGSGWTTYYELTFKGKKQAEKASGMPPVWEEQKEEMGPGIGIEARPETTEFYLLARPGANPDEHSGNPFYKVQDEQVAKSLCALFNKEYGEANGGTVFRHCATASRSAEDQVLLDESIQWLEAYSEPDPGLYDPEPPKDMFILAQYAVRARGWEDLLREKGQASSPVKAVPPERGSEALPLTTDKLPEMPAEEWRIAGLHLLMMLAQAYYKILESAIGVPCGAVDLELNQNYLWTLKNLRNLLTKHPDLADFPTPFEPVFPDLFPSTVRDYDWEDMVAPDAERFLSTVQGYVINKGMYEPSEGSPAYFFIEMFRPGIKTAIDSGIAYRGRMTQHFQKVLKHVSKDVANQDPGGLAAGVNSQSNKDGRGPSETKVGATGTSLDALHGAIGNVGKDVKTVLQHVRGVPVLQADLKEARVVPEAAALDVLNKIRDILTLDQQEIWTTMRDAGGVQKTALAVLNRLGRVKSTATLCRRVAEIDEILVKNGLSPCDASAPAMRYRKSGGFKNDEGRAVPDDLSAVEKDWAKDELERNRTIQSFLSASGEDKEFFRKTKPGIDAEAERYLKRKKMMSD